MPGYLESVIENNPDLPRIAVELHQEGRIPPNTFVFDLDQVAENAQALVRAGKENALTLYLMSKQHNRNPFVNALGVHFGFHKMVCVDIQGILAAERYGIPIGHVGHLNQIPHSFIPRVLDLSPEVWTVYDLATARILHRMAREKGVVQNILVKLYDRENGDFFFDGQESGVALESLRDWYETVTKLSNLKLIGATVFPCMRYNEESTETVELAPNARTLVRGIEVLKELGCEIRQINAPGNTSVLNMPLLKDLGATHVEPGNALLGTTPSHSFRRDLVEKTAFVYVTEVSHFYDDRAYALGGGAYHTNYYPEMDALAGSDPKRIFDRRFPYLHEVVQDIDYHMQLNMPEGAVLQAGDSVIMAFRTQMHMTRSYMAGVSGLNGKRPLRIHRLLDCACNPLDADYRPIDPLVLRREIDALLKEY